MSSNRSPSFAKNYPLHQSPLYKIGSKKKLLSLLKIDKESFKKISTNQHFNVFKNDSGRIIQHPIGKLEVVHKRIYNLLKCIELPTYLHSGRKNRSTKSNANVHRTSLQMLKVDISKFFPSNDIKKIENAFVYEFKMPRDVALALASLIAYEGKLPTGSQVSMLMAYYANKKMFDELSSISEENNLKMTVYVDDIAFSGNSIPKGFLRSVKKIISEASLLVKPRKVKIYRDHQAKMITGVILKDGAMTVRNRSLLSIHTTYRSVFSKEYQARSDIELLYLRLKGKLHAAGQI
ncbi:Reverse transcriptase (RNA-dependent DNA polymerase), partial [Rosenbergiella nectarea]